MGLQGIVPALTPTNKIPGDYLESRDEVGAGAQTRYLWIVAAKDSGATGTLTIDSEVRDITSDADALTAWGANSRGYRMALQALAGGQGGISIKGSAYTISGGAAATATITIDGTWTVAGELFYRLAGKPIGPIGVAASDTVQNVADAIAAYINADDSFAATAGVAAGGGTEYVVTLTSGSYGTAGNLLTIWQDMSRKPSGLTSTLAGGTALASGGKYFTGGAGTISLANLLTATFSNEFVTQVCDVTDTTNLGRLETQIDTKLGPLEGRLECALLGLVGTVSASGSIAQSTLNSRDFEALWMEESEVPGEEFAARFAAMRHLAEFSSAPDAPNQRYDWVYLPWMVAQEAPSKRPSRATIKSALNYGLTPLATENGRVYLVRAVTTRTLTDTAAADDGTVDVAQDRVAKEYRRGLKAVLGDHRANHKFLDNDPAEGDEPGVDASTTYPKRIRDVVKLFNQQKALDGWLAQVEDAVNQPQVALNPNVSPPRAVVYAPFVPKPLYHQTEGVVAKRKFLVTASA